MYVTRISRDYLTHIGTPNLNQVVNSEMIPRASKGIWLGCAGLMWGRELFTPTLQNLCLNDLLL